MVSSSGVKFVVFSLKACISRTASRNRPPVLSNTMARYSASLGHRPVSRHKISCP